jgi:hypothetical protein
MYEQHPDEEVQRALIRLCDALCSWERATGRQSVLILREAGGYVFRAGSGKPDIPADLSDDLLMRQLNATGN